MKAILEFNLPEEECEFQVYSRAKDFYFVLFNLNNILRSYSKHNNFIDIHDAIETIRKALSDEMMEHEISLDMLP